MSQLSIKLSDRADALIAQLQKEIFNRRRKKVTAAGVIETLVESGAKSQSDKRFATSWKNLVADIEKAAKVADAHGAKPASLSDEEWALVLSHRTRTPRAATPAKRRTPARKPAAAKPAAAAKSAAAKPAATKPATRKPSARKPVVKAATSTNVSTKRTRSSVAKRMAKAVSRLETTTPPAVASGHGNGAVKQPLSV
ncbi:MAG: hypothetical protein RLZZ336_467 [Cyanobacteriota bacterium]